MAGCRVQGHVLLWTWVRGDVRTVPTKVELPMCLYFVCSSMPCSSTACFPNSCAFLRGLTSRKECCRYLAQKALSRHLAAGKETLPIPWNTLATALASMGTSCFSNNKKNGNGERLIFAPTAFRRQVCMGHAQRKRCETHHLAPYLSFHSRVDKRHTRTAIYLPNTRTNA